MKLTALTNLLHENHNDIWLQAIELYGTGISIFLSIFGDQFVLLPDNINATHVKLYHLPASEALSSAIKEDTIETPPAEAVCSPTIEWDDSEAMEAEDKRVKVDMLLKVQKQLQEITGVENPIGALHHASEPANQAPRHASEPAGSEMLLTDRHEITPGVLSAVREYCTNSLVPLIYGGPAALAEGRLDPVERPLPESPTDETVGYRAGDVEPACDFGTEDTMGD